MDPPKLRALASNYVMEFLQGVEKLIVGTLEGNPAINGQTLQEEKGHEGSQTMTILIPTMLIIT